MKRFFVAVALFSAVSSVGAGPRKYAPPYRLAQGVELPRTEFVSYRSQRDAVRDDCDSSQYYIGLNGAWCCRFFDSEAAVPQELAGGNVGALERMVASWDTVSLPGAWEIAGHGGRGKAVFASRAYDFAEDRRQVRPPYLPGGRNGQVAVYVRKFTVPFDLFDKAHFLHIGAVKAGARIFVNGEEVGFSRVDSKNPAEFDITKYVSEGRNWVAIVVPQWTEASYLEDWQGWRLSGINRGLYVFAQPKIRMRDYLVRTTLDPTYTNWLLETAMLLKTQLLNPFGVTVYYDLYDPQGKLVNSNFRDVEVGMRVEDTVRFTASIPNVAKWTAEQPNLYTILYRIKREGRFTEYVACRVGFRTVEVEGERFLVNGRPVVFKGVNLAEHADSTGNFVNEAQMRRMLDEMKLAGVNAVRTDGYPLPSSFYKLCDELGFYVCDVANINTWGLGSSLYRGGTISNDPAWREAYLARIDAMYERNKNHPSVVMWSLGDRSGNGYNMYQGYLMLKHKERTRPVVYNGAAMEWNTDVYCPDYPKSAENGSGRPMIPSRVGVDPVWWTAPGAQGAFLERWNDMTLTAQVPGGKYLLADDYKRVPMVSDEAFVTVAVSTNEAVRTLFANVAITQVDGARGVYRFENRMQFADLKDFQVRYQLMVGGRLAREGILNVAAAPGKSVDVQIPAVGGAGKDRKLLITVGHIARAEF